MKLLNGKHTCKCGEKYEWNAYFLDNGEVISSRMENLIKNVVDKYKDANKYTVILQCPRCFSRYTISESIRSTE